MGWGRTRALRVAAALAVAGALTAGMAGCVPEPGAGEARHDPAPSFADARTTQVDREGARWSAAGVTVDVPRGSVTANVANVTVGPHLGEASSGIATEVFGQPVRIDSVTALAEPVTVSWDVAALPDEAAEAAALVRWDDRRRVWVPEPGVPAVTEGALSVQLTESGIVTWATVALADVPASAVASDAAPDAAPDDCGDAPLPDWVAGFVDPDRERPQSAVAACAEAHQSDALTVKTRNRDTVSRVLELQGDAEFDWSAPEGPRSRFWTVAEQLVAGSGTALLPPGGAVDVGLSAQDDAGPEGRRAVARVDARTSTLDLLAAFARRTSLGDVADPATTALITSLYGCAVPDAVTPADAAAVADLGAALTDCAEQLTDAQTPAAREFAEAAASGTAEADAAERVQGARAAAAALRVGAGGAFEALAQTRSAALVEGSQAPLGGASWAVLDGREAPALGTWRPVCSGVEADAAALQAELLRQPGFADPSRAPATDPAWRSAAAEAVAPLAGCTADERAHLAARLPDQWADPAAAEAVVDAISGLGLSQLSCDDLFDLVAPVAKGFHPLKGITASGTGRVACGWAEQKGRTVGDAEVTSRVEVWVSRETVDADEVAIRRAAAERTELGGVQQSDAVDAAGGFVVGAYVPSGLEIESWLPGYRIAITAASSDDPAQWRMPEAIAAVEHIATALTAD
ncbi:hypothetical protein [Microbacterium sp. NPDC096154]|uniref:hypothetical protein n=1 Tax=Microbacterium sp. NPDC096154 TaxID=3155549 RepID=UPI0033273D1E